MMAERRSTSSTSADSFLPEHRSLPALAKAATNCRGCDLYRNATQVVFGEGKRTARVIFVGEQPGDKEDLAGHPFVGPAGRILDEGLRDAGIDREDVYLTNAVKHFKWEPRGKRRLHAKPNARELSACRPWLDAEIDAIHPELIVCLGATAAQSLLGSSFRITKQRGIVVSTDDCSVLATWHPAAILRAPSDDARAAMQAEFVSDLRLVRQRMRSPHP